MDYGSLLYAPIYGVIGVPAQLVVSESDGPLGLTVIDKTAGVQVADSDNPEVTRIIPVACARMTEITSLLVTRAQLDNSTITFNGRTWTIKSTALVPSPAGEDNGEVYLYLEAA